MRRFITILFMLVFLLANVGIPCYAHYCVKKLTETTGFAQQKKCCCHKTSSSSKDMDGCCKSQVKLMKVDDSYLKQEVKTNLPVLSLHFVISYILNFGEQIVPQTIDNYYVDKPPLVNKVSIPVLHQSFLI